MNGVQELAPFDLPAEVRFIPHASQSPEPQHGQYNQSLTAPAALESSPGHPDVALLEVSGGQLNSLRQGHLGFPIQAFSSLGNV